MGRRTSPTDFEAMLTAAATLRSAGAPLRHVPVNHEVVVHIRLYEARDRSQELAIESRASSPRVALDTP